MPARLLPGLALCLLLAPLAGAGRLTSCAVPVGDGVPPGGLRVTALPSLAGAKPVQEEGGTAPLSSLVLWVVWVLFLVWVSGPSRRGPGGSRPLAQAAEVEALGWLEVESHEERDWSLFPGDTPQEGPCGPQDWALPPQTPHLGAECPDSRPGGQGLLWGPPSDAPTSHHGVSTLLMTMGQTPSPGPSLLLCPPPGALRGGAESALSPDDQALHPGRRGLAQPVSRVPPSRPLRRAAGHALLAFLHV